MKLTSSETRWRRLIAKWTAPKGFAAIMIFFLITLIFEILLVYSFHSFGLVDFVLTEFRARSNVFQRQLGMCKKFKGSNH
jgi:hypothetical protein